MSEPNPDITNEKSLPSDSLYGDGTFCTSYSTEGRVRRALFFLFAHFSFHSFFLSFFLSSLISSFIRRACRLEDEALQLKREEEKKAAKQIDIGKEAAIEAEVKAARERAVVPLEIRMKQFRDMLAEKEVSVILHRLQFVFRYH